MIHHWAEEMMVRPRSVGMVEEGGLFLNNYICMKPVKSLQMYPRPTSSAKAPSTFYSLLVGIPGFRNRRGRKNLSQSGRYTGRDHRPGHHQRREDHQPGDLIGEVPGIKAHLECKGLFSRAA